MIGAWIVSSLVLMMMSDSAGAPMYRPAPVVARSANCEPSRYAGDGDIPAIPRLPSPGCPVDGDIIVLALDSSRVLVATRDSSEAASPGAAYIVFITAPGAVPRALAWSSRAGHALNNGYTDFYVMSGDPSVQPLALEFSQRTLIARHPDALTIAVQSIVLVERSALSWDMLSRLSSAPRCGTGAGAPALGLARRGAIAWVDALRARSAAVGDGRDCFVIDGRHVSLP